MTKRTDERNLNPHAEAVVAMNLYAQQYADQNGGCMDFWDKLEPGRKQRCKALVDRIKGARRALVRKR